jgi:hypothetical protein
MELLASGITTRCSEHIPRNSYDITRPENGNMLYENTVISALLPI